MLDDKKLQNYTEAFNATDNELYQQAIPNKEAFDWLRENIPFFDCPDKNIERTYYFRWWSLRKHIKHTPDGYVFTEFLPPVPWAGKYNTINCPAGQHFREARWLRQKRYLEDYAVFWLRGGGGVRDYSFWLGDSLRALHFVHPNKTLCLDLLPDLVKNYQAWEAGHAHGNQRIGQRDNGLFYTLDALDGGEMSIAGHGFRPTLNSYMYGDARAIAAFADLAGDRALAQTYRAKAAALKKLVQEKLWHPELQFFTVRSAQTDTLAAVRELWGYAPWYFNLPDAGYEVAWSELMKSDGFYAPYGPTSVEQRHPDFNLSYTGHECQWNGPSWPLATSVALSALINLLNDYQQDYVTAKDFFAVLQIYAACHKLQLENGQLVPWIDENINPYTGDWIARTRLRHWHGQGGSAAKGGEERGKDYNHSSFNDLLISGLLGLRPTAANEIYLNPLLPAKTWAYFCLDQVRYKERALTIFWDADGARYQRGAGLHILLDGQPAASAAELAPLRVKL